MKYEYFQGGRDAFKGGLLDWENDDFYIALIKDGLKLDKTWVSILDLPRDAIIAFKKLDGKFVTSKRIAEANDVTIKNVPRDVSFGEFLVFHPMPGSLRLDGMNICSLSGPWAPALSGVNGTVTIRWGNNGIFELPA